MLRRLIGIAVACSFLGLPLAVRAQAVDPKGPAQTIGTAKNRPDAISEALGLAMAQAISETLPKDVLLSNKDLVTRIFSDSPKSWVQDSRVLREDSPTTGVVRVLVSSNVNGRKIREELARLGILFDRAKRPTFSWISCVEGGQGMSPKSTTFSSEWMKKISERFRTLGYRIDEGSEAADIGMSATVSQLQGRTLAFEVTPAFQRSRTEAGRIQVSYSLGESPELVAGLVAVRFLSQVLPAWFRQTGEGKLFEIAVRGLRSYPAYKELKDIFNSGAHGFTSGRESSFASGSAIFEVVYDGEIAALARALAGVHLKSGAIKVLETTDRTVLVETK